RGEGLEGIFPGARAVPVTFASLRPKGLSVEAFPPSLTLFCASPPCALTTSCILLLCSRKLVTGAGCVCEKKRFEVPALMPAGADVNPRLLTCKLSRVGTTPRFPEDTRA